MSMLRNFSSSDACSSTVSVLIRASHACPCLINCLSTIRHFAAQAQLAHDSSSDEQSGLAASSSTMHRRASASFRHSKLLWQQVSGLSMQQAQQLLQQQPFLEPILQTSFHHSNLSSNINVLQTMGFDTQQPLSEQLRAYLSLLPPGLLHEITGKWGPAATSNLPATLQHLAYRLNRQPTQQQLWQRSQPSSEQIGQLLHVLDHVPQRQQQQPQPVSLSPLQQLAAAVTEALGLRDQPLPSSMKVDEGLLRQAVRHNSSRHSSSSSSSSSQRDHSPVRQPYGGSSSSSRTYHTRAVVPVTCEQYLASALERTSRAVGRAGKDPPSVHTTVQQLQQVQQQSGMSEMALFQLLAARPGLLWGVTQSPGSVLRLLLQHLPALAAPAAAGRAWQQQRQQQVSVLAKLLLQNPALLTISEQQTAEALDLLLNRLRLTPDEAAAVVAANPKLLINPVKATSLNLGFLVGLGFRPADLKQMVTRSPDSVTRQMKDITLNWKFITTATKATVADVVHFPQLLSLSITTRLGPRLAYARKRGVKLLLPSEARLQPDLSHEQWIENKWMPLEVWLKKSDKVICKAMGLSLEDFTRFRHAWNRVDGAAWKQASSSRVSIRLPAA